jgi:hypothetical protein
MFETTKLPEWRELFSVVEQNKPGDVVTHEQIAAALKIVKNGKRYFQQVQRWRREEMTVRHRQWRTLRGVGYELQAPNQHRSIASSHVTRARKATRRAHSTLAHTDMDRLSDWERLQHINAEARAGVLYQIAQATEKELKHLPTGSVQPMLSGSVPKPV